MNFRPFLAAVVLATCFTGCATFSNTEMTQIRQHGVSPVVVGKMETGHALTPRDVIELTHRGVPDDYIIRQIDDVGVDYILNRDDVKRLQAAHVSRPVMEALFAASDEFAGNYAPGRRPGVSVAYPYNDYYGPYAPYPYYYPYGGVSVVVGGGHWHHWH